MSEETIMVLVRVSLFSPLLALSALIILGKSASGFVWKALFVFLAVSFSCDFLADWLAENRKINMPVFHIYNFLIGAIICYYYARVLKFEKIRLVISWFFFFFLIASAIEFFYAKGYLNINTVSQFVLCIISLFLAILWFYQIFFSEEQMQLTKLPEFWVNVGFFFYFGSTMVLTLFSEMILYTGGDHELTMKLWPIQLFTNILFNLIILRAVWALKRA